jgi:hypothetical protein
VLASEGGHYNKTVRLWSLLPVRLTYRPIRQTTLDDLAWAQGALRDGQISNKQRKALEFIVELMMWHRRFDIEVGDAMRYIEVGEFDIEIEG